MVKIIPILCKEGGGSTKKLKSLEQESMNIILMSNNENWRHK